jgi:transcriptional regulator with XRE-family HTH domain
MAGRPEKALDPREPAQAFAQRLRDLRRRSGQPTYAQMADRSHYSAATLSEAARGNTVPSWDVTAAYVRACGGDPEQWRTPWKQAKEGADDPKEAAGSSGISTPAAQSQGFGAPARSAAAAPVTSATGGANPAVPAVTQGWGGMTSRRWKWGLAVAVVLVVILVTIALIHDESRQARGTNGAQPSAPITSSATFLRPADGERIADITQLPVQFTVRGLPTSRTLWCFVKNDDNRWFPYRVQGPQDGRWQSIVGVGPEKPKDELVFVLHVVEATPEANARIEDALQRSSPDWTGLDGLPPGATSIGFVTVVRKR